MTTGPDATDITDDPPEPVPPRTGRWYRTKLGVHGESVVAGCRYPEVEVWPRPGDERVPGYVRVEDESGEDYLHPRALFEDDEA